MSKICINSPQVQKIAELLANTHVPHEQESSTHSFQWTGDKQSLANCYFAIVAICHQTSPIGERRLEGHVDGVQKYGWDYLKERFLRDAIENPKWASSRFWCELTPYDLSELYEDGNHFGKTLNRINERTSLLNEVGDELIRSGFHNIRDAFYVYNGIALGESGFLEFLKRFRAYSDPLMKKGLFFLSVMATECDWRVKDISELPSPVDYHELRGHLRIGTFSVKDPSLLRKLTLCLPIADEEDIELRSKAQNVNEQISKRSGLSNSIIHYLFWNIFRNCCPRDSSETHCVSCGDKCKLPKQYKEMSTYHNQCIFARVCKSVNEEIKVTEPPYVGYFY